jgi:hypothetical protein
MAIRIRSAPRAAGLGMSPVAGDPRTAPRPLVEAQFEGDETHGYGTRARPVRRSVDVRSRFEIVDGAAGSWAAVAGRVRRSSSTSISALIVMHQCSASLWMMKSTMPSESRLVHDNVSRRKKDRLVGWDRSSAGTDTARMRSPPS